MLGNLWKHVKFEEQTKDECSYKGRKLKVIRIAFLILILSLFSSKLFADLKAVCMCIAACVCVCVCVWDKPGWVDNCEAALMQSVL